MNKRVLRRLAKNLLRPVLIAIIDNVISNIKLFPKDDQKQLKRILLVVKDLLK